MPTYTLQTYFTQDALIMLYTTGTNVVIAKPSSGDSSPDVAWIVFRPLQVNTITWEEQYGIYASTQSIQNGATLTQMCITTPFPAMDGKVYTVGTAGSFGPPQGGGTPGSYTAVNQYNNLPPNGPGYLTLGLYQNAWVNGIAMNGNAISAAMVPYQNEATMTPFTTIYLWTQSQVRSNTVVTSVSSVQTKVTFGGSVTTVALYFDPQTGGFIPTGATLEADEKTGKLLMTGGEDLGEGITMEHRIPVL